MSTNPKLKLYADSDMVDAVFGGEEVQIPKKWIGTEYADGYTVDTKDDVVIPDGDPSEKWTVPQLKAYAERESIELGDATKKDDVFKVILDAKTSPPA